MAGVCGRRSRVKKPAYPVYSRTVHPTPQCFWQAHVDAALGRPPPWAAYQAEAPRAPHTPWNLAAAELWRGSGFLAEALARVLGTGGAPAACAAGALLVAAVADARARAAAPAPAGLGSQGETQGPFFWARGL